MPPGRSPLVLINAVGLTGRLLAHAPRFAAIASQGWTRNLVEVLPAVTCTAQATLLTGELPNVHGVVANGWLFRDTMEVRFWQQSNRLLRAEPLYRTLGRTAAQGRPPFRCAKLFWWFNQGADVSISLTPKPHYGADGSKVFAVAGTPPALVQEIERRIGPFPFHSFWGPNAGLGCTTWIALCAAHVMRHEQPDLTLVYLPHLDYDPQRLGPSQCDMHKLVGQLDAAADPLLEAARAVGARVWIVSEYGHRDVAGPVYANRLLRQAQLLAVRRGPFGETIDTFASRAFAVCDHQLCHVYVHPEEDPERVADVLRAESGIDRLFIGAARDEITLAHERAGEIIALAKPDRWFAYPFWLDDRFAPDFARTVDIHRKPGFDPCEMFFDPRLFWPRGRIAWRLVQKMLGLRTLFDVVPLDASLVGGSHGLRADDPADRPILIGDGPHPTSNTSLCMTQVRHVLLQAALE